MQTSTWVSSAVVGFDTETTGVDIASDRIVTAALVVRQGLDGAERTRTWLLDPGIEIPDAATQVHGITTAHARSHGQDAATGLEEIAGALAAQLSRGAPVVAYNAAFDLSILEHELARHQLVSLHDRLGGAIAPVLDPLVLDREKDRYRRGKRRLGDLCAHYGVVTGDLHTADVDVAATLDVLAALVRAYPELAASELPALHSQQVAGHRAWARSFNEWLAQRNPGRAGADESWPTHAVGPASTR